MRGNPGVRRKGDDVTAAAYTAALACLADARDDIEARILALAVEANDAGVTHREIAPAVGWSRPTLVNRLREARA